MDLTTILIAAAVGVVCLAGGMILGPRLFGASAPAPIASVEAKVAADVQSVKERAVSDVLAWLTDTSSEQRTIAAAQASIARRQLLAQHVVAQLAPAPAAGDPTPPASA